MKNIMQNMLFIEKDKVLAVDLIPNDILNNLHKKDSYTLKQIEAYIEKYLNRYRIYNENNIVGYVLNELNISEINLNEYEYYIDSYINNHFKEERITLYKIAEMLKAGYSIEKIMEEEDVELDYVFMMLILYNLYYISIILKKIQGELELRTYNQRLDF